MCTSCSDSTETTTSRSNALLDPRYDALAECTSSQSSLCQGLKRPGIGDCSNRFEDGVMRSSTCGKNADEFVSAVCGWCSNDALGDLAAVILEGNSAGVGLGHRFVNRAHNRTNKHHRGVRHHGRTVPSTVDPLPTDRVVEHQDRQGAPADIGDVVAARVDLERFRMAIAAAITAGELTEEAWKTYADHRLRVVYLPARSPVPTRQRVAAYRAAKRLQPIVDFHLQGHAA